MFDLDIYASADDLQFILYRFDKNKDGRISFKEVRICSNNYSLNKNFYQSLRLTIDVK